MTRRLVISLAITVLLFSARAVARQIAFKPIDLSNATLTTTGASQFQFAGNGSRVWLRIPCGRNSEGCQSGLPPPKVVFEDYPDTSELCIAAKAPAPEVCIPYGAFKQWASSK